MHKTASEAAVLAEAVLRALPPPNGVEVVLCPPFTALAAVARVIAGSPVALGAQDVHWEREGAYTGEISPEMLRDLGCRYVIIGHSERRQYFAETDERVNRKTGAALAGGLTPIVCIGETLAEREAGRAAEVVAGQVKGALSGLAPEQVRGVVLAYEPIWAIGTGRTATPLQAAEMHARVRRTIAELCGRDVAEQIRILYGGSVGPENASALLREPEIDGALVGGASLRADAFAAIARAAAGHRS
jgi:triosephosphate isomerase